MKTFKTCRHLSLLFFIVFVWSVPSQAAGLPIVPQPRMQASDALNKNASVGELWKRTELYFGSDRPNGSSVTKEQFQRFIDENVTPRFPDGLTVLTGYGQFRNSAGRTVREKSMVLILFYPFQMTDANEKIEAIRRDYKDAFQQESVLRVDSVALISF